MTWTSSGRYWCFMERSMARFRRWLRASTTSRGSRASASLMSRSWYGSYRSSYRSPAPTTRQTRNPISAADDEPGLPIRGRPGRECVGGRGGAVQTVLAEAGGDGVPVGAGQRVPARVHEPRRELGEHPREASRRFRGLV